MILDGEIIQLSVILNQTESSILLFDKENQRSNRGFKWENVFLMQVLI